MNNKKIFTINLIYYICMVSVAIIFLLGYMDIIDSSYLSTFLIQGIVMLAMPLILYSVFISKNWKQTLNDFGFKKISLKIIIISIFLGFILFLVNGYVADIFYAILSIFGYDNSINISLSVNNIGLEFVLTALVPGFCEEVLHRGMYMRGIQKQGYTRYGLLFSSILFGLMHLNIQQFFYATILGSLMGIVVIVADSIYPAMIIHFMNNALSTYFVYGYYRNWPLARFKYYLENLIFSTNFVMCILILSSVIFLLLWTYKYLLKQITKEKQKQIANSLAKDLKLDQADYNEVQQKLNEIESILQQTNPQSNTTISNENSIILNFVDKVFLYSSIVLGSLITFCSFIWGIL